MFFVRSAEQNPCPCCSSKLEIIGSRRRKYINVLGEIITLVIRRLRCTQCNRVHHELPDILVPYKRYCSECIEAVVGDETPLMVPADESTIYRWRSWFQVISVYLLGCLVSICVRSNEKAAENISCLPQSPLQRIWHYVGDSSRWLARVVRPVANWNYWIQTVLHS